MTWRALPAVALALAVTVLAGCTSSDRDQVEQNQQIATQIEDELVASGEFEHVSVGYADPPAEYAGLSIEVNCRGCRMGKVADRLAKRVWLSRISPLQTFSILVHDPGAVEELHREYWLDDDAPELSSKYGERPVSSTPG